MLIHELREYARPKLTGKKIRDIRAGLGYTGVLLDDNTCGLAYTFRNEIGHGCSMLGDAGQIIGRDGEEMSAWAESKNRLKAAIGLATINAAINHDPALAWQSGNISGALNLAADDTCAMIGEFGPIMPLIQQKTRQLYVFEQNIRPGSGYFSPEKMPELLPQCDIVIITATSIINHTLDGILEHCQQAREVCLLGPSTPLCPAVFRPYRVTLLAGSIVLDADQALQIISQGGGTMNLKPYVNQVLLKI